MRIFINYRRHDTRIATGRIDDHLRQEFGEHAVFRDIDNIPLASDFVEHIEEAVGHSTVMLVVIGSQWVSPRLHEENDFVRLEIESALKARVPVIPVVIESASMPTRDQIPASLLPLLRRQGLRLDFGREFRTHFRWLVDGIKELHSRERPSSQVRREAQTTPSDRMAKAIAGEGLCATAADQATEGGRVVETEISAVPRHIAAAGSRLSRELPQAPATLAPGLLEIGRESLGASRSSEPVGTKKPPQETGRPGLRAERSGPIKRMLVERSRRVVAVSAGCSLVLASIAFMTSVALRGHVCEATDVNSCAAQCNRGNAASCLNLGVMYVNGTGVAKDATRGAALYKQGCDGGDARACGRLGDAYASGTGVMADARRAAASHKQGCDGGDARACGSLGDAYTSGTGVMADAGRAAALYKQGCDGGDARACGRLGDAYTSGTGVTVDAKRAAASYKQGCRGGDAHACGRLGDAYTSGTGVTVDAKRAAASYELGCDSGDAHACGGLADAYASGAGVRTDLTLAAVLYKQSCDGGDGRACNTLGDMCASPETTEDVRLDAALYERGCDGGDSRACSKLGQVYATGTGAKIDFVRAAALYQRGCDGGDYLGCVQAIVATKHEEQRIDALNQALAAKKKAAADKKLREEQEAQWADATRRAAQDGERARAEVEADKRAADEAAQKAREQREAEERAYEMRRAEEAERARAEQQNNQRRMNELNNIVGVVTSHH